MATENETALIDLTPAQLESWKRDGFLYIKAQDFWTPQQIENLKKWTADVETWTETPGKWMMYFSKSVRQDDEGRRLLHRLENFFDFHAGFNEAFNGERFLHLVTQLFNGDRAILHKEKINFKYPGGEGFEPHQDHAAGWWMYGQSLHISIMVNIDQATKENGCLEVVAGEHNKGLLGPEFQAVPQELVDKYTWIPLETNPGDIVFFDSYVPHRSAPNLSDKPRRVLYVTYSKEKEGDYRSKYYEDKRQSFPPDCEREEGKDYSYKI
jgi:hypothetical protein